MTTDLQYQDGWDDALNASHDEITRLRAEVEALKATLTQQCKGYRADVEKLEAEVEALRAAAREVYEWADAAQWALGNETGVPAAKLDALRAAIGVEAAQGDKT